MLHGGPHITAGHGATRDGSSSAGLAVPKLGHIPGLDGLRGVAIALVLAYHVGPLKGGFLGVDVFFVLSGFLITTLLIEEHAATGSISFHAFYQRRARRLLPVAFAAIMFAEILIVGADGFHRQAWTGVYSAFYVENFAHFLSPPAISQLGHFWSLSQEEQFYFVWPPVLLLLLRRGIPGRRVAGGLAAAALLIIVHRATLADHWARFYYAPDTHADGMALGCLVAISHAHGWLRRIRRWEIAALAGLAVIVTDATLIESGSRAAGLFGITVANLSASVLVAAVATAPAGWFQRALAVRPLAFLGLISYSLYIWQPLVVSVAGLHGTAMLVCAILLGLLSYRYIERPFRRGRRDKSGPTPAPVSALGRDIESGRGQVTPGGAVPG
jgi:peptidoglycan/LPS O-acetylase OafA/YrhL